VAGAQRAQEHLGAAQPEVGLVVGDEQAKVERARDQRGRADEQKARQRPDIEPQARDRARSGLG
jgi:hypothetical protein